MRPTAVLWRDWKALLDHFSQYHPTPLTIKQFIDFGQQKCERKSFMFLRKELPVRLANIIREISELPPELRSMPSIALVDDWYKKSFTDILDFENVEYSARTQDRFNSTLVRVRNRHSGVVQTVAQGVMELKQYHQVDVQKSFSIQYFLDRFYMSRISIRMLINQHTLLFGSDVEGAENPTGHVGCINPQCDLVGVVKDAYENARFLCDQYYLASPTLLLEEINDVEHGAPIRIVYVPSHLYHMLFELFKNSMRAVMEHHGDADDAVPPIEVVICRGMEDICVKMSDKGGGIPRSKTHLLFNYMYSTAQPPKSDHHTVPLAGYGYGLPISRLYARYFDGDLKLTSCEGYGTDAMIYLKALSSEANEILPVYNKASSKNYRTISLASDWSHGSTLSVRGAKYASDLRQFVG